MPKPVTVERGAQPFVAADGPPEACKFNPRRGPPQNNTLKRAMSTDDMFRKWTPIDQNALLEISQLTTSTGIHQLGTTALPAPIQQMPGAVSYFVSAYSTPINIGSGTILGGELAVVRTDQEKWKAYNYAFASSGDGRVYFNGPYKNFPEHHFSSTSQVSLENLFGHIPYSTKSTL